MSSLPKIQDELNLTSSMRQIMEIMKGMALSAFVANKNMREGRFNAYTAQFHSFFHLIDLSKQKSPFINCDANQICVIAITSNESFMAGLNNKIMKKAVEKVGNQDCHWVVTGPRMLGKLRQMEVDYTVFPGFREHNMVEVATQIKDFIMENMREAKFSKVFAVFADPVSLSKQEIRAVTLLPAHHVYPQQMNEGIDTTETVLTESTIDNVMLFLSEVWILRKLIELFQDNKVAEGAAQAMQLDGNLENLTEYERKLYLQFRKTRREIIDTALRETVSAMLAAPSS